MTQGRPREFDKEQALDAAMHLFWRQGYEATSMQNLLDTMQLSKSSLYQTFGSKHELFQQCLKHYRDMMTTDSLQQLAQAATGREFIERIFLSVVERAKKPADRIGCLVMNTAAELAQRDKDIGKLIKLGIESFIRVFEQAVAQAQREGDISPDKNPRALGRFLMNNLSGLNSMAKAGASEADLKDIVKQVMHSLE